jgi:2,3-bisphosphoglycerate-independent phosphoglycerate mutase
MFTIDKEGEKKIKTSHTLNPVPFAIYDPCYNGEYRMATIEKPGLSNVASTIMNLLGYEKVKDYDPSLLTFPKPFNSYKIIDSIET